MRRPLGALASLAILVVLLLAALGPAGGQPGELAHGGGADEYGVAITADMAEIAGPNISDEDQQRRRCVSSSFPCLSLPNDMSVNWLDKEGPAYPVRTTEIPLDYTPRHPDQPPRIAA